MTTEAPSTQSLVFPDIKAATHMPYFDGSTLLFCQSGEVLERTVINTGTIWKTLRQRPELAEKFKNLPRTQQVPYRAWKIHSCDWETKEIKRVKTGLPDGASERSPSMYQADNQVHLSFLSGVPSIVGPNYLLYTCSGPDLEHLGPPIVQPYRHIFFGFISPHHICWGRSNVLNLKERATENTFKFQFDCMRISSASFLSESPSKLVITTLDHDHNYQTVLFDLATKSASSLNAESPLYKPSFHGQQAISVQKLKEGFENRQLYTSDFKSSPSSLKISPLA